MIIAFLGKTVKSYRENYLILLEQINLICPICNGKCHSHCWYDRKIRSPEPIVIKILRIKCTNCKSTHAILPDILFPKGRYSELMREEVIVDCETGGKTQEEVSGNQSIKTTGRWIKRYRRTIETIIAALRSVLARLREYETMITGTGLEQLRQMCVGVERTLGREINSSGLFGKINILLSWGTTGVWI